MVNVRGATKRPMVGNLPIVKRRRGTRTRHVAAGVLPVVAAHTTAPATGRLRAAGRGPVGRDGELRQRLDTLTSGPATTGRIAISHSDHLHRSAGHQNR